MDTKGMAVIRGALETCSVASCLWKHESRPSRIRIVIKTDADWFEVEVPVKLSYSEARLRDLIVERVTAARKDRRIHGASVSRDRETPRGPNTADMFEVAV